MVSVIISLCFSFLTPAFLLPTIKNEETRARTPTRTPNGIEAGKLTTDKEVHKPVLENAFERVPQPPALQSTAFFTRFYFLCQQCLTSQSKVKLELRGEASRGAHAEDIAYRELFLI